MYLVIWPVAVLLYPISPQCSELGPPKMNIIKMPQYPSIIPALLLFLDGYYYSGIMFTGLLGDHGHSKDHRDNIGNILVSLAFNGTGLCSAESSAACARTCHKYTTYIKNLMVCRSIEIWRIKRCMHWGVDGSWMTKVASDVFLFSCSWFQSLLLGCITGLRFVMCSAFPWLSHILLLLLLIFIFFLLVWS